MIVDLKTLQKDEELKNINADVLFRKVKAIEKSIRKYTNNNFIDPNFRFFGEIKDKELHSNAVEFLKAGDNIQISNCLNDGIYTIEEIEESKIILLEEKNLFDCKNVKIIKVVYEEDIQEGVINMLKWDLKMRKKIGIKSETLSRHSVTYFDMDKNNSLKGYPSSLLNFLDDYMKARF